MGLNMSFIKLTQCKNSEAMLINTTDISLVMPAETSGDTYIRMKSPINGNVKTEFFFVKESIKDIERMLSVGMVSAHPLDVKLNV